MSASEHFQYKVLLKAAKSVMTNGARHNIMLTGPTGSGKSSAAINLAKDLGLPYYFIEQAMLGTQVVGSLDPRSGEWKHTGLTRAAMGGGVVVFEEYDGWHPNATLASNVPLANRLIQNPATGEVMPLHKDCIVIAATNTWGNGATLEYVGRNKMDAAARDRFGVRIDWRYDEKLEQAMCDNFDVVEFVQLCRENATKAGLKVVISPRSSIVICDLVRQGFTLAQAADLNFLAGLSKTDRAVILEGTEALLFTGNGKEGGLPFPNARGWVKK